jgi:hypothetical protein
MCRIWTVNAYYRVPWNIALVPSLSSFNSVYILSVCLLNFDLFNICFVITYMPVM